MKDGPLQVLLIEDDEDDCLIFKGLLSEVPSQKYDVRWVSAYGQALQEIVSSRYDVCLLDYHLGKRDGLDFLRETIVQRCRIPIILLTGKGDHTLDIEAMELGAADYLVKDEITSRLLERSIRFSIREKEVEEALRESETRFRQMFEKSIAVKLIIDPVSENIADANLAACRFYGYSLEQLKRMRVSDINQSPPERISQNMHMALAERQNQFYFQHKLASGEIREVEVLASPINVWGRVFLHTIVHDVTERKRAEEELEAHSLKLEETNRVLSNTLEQLATAEKELLTRNAELAKTAEDASIQRLRYRELFEYAPDGYIVSDQKGVIREANHAAEALLGSPAEFLTGKPMATFVPKGNKRLFGTQVRTLKTRKQIKGWELRLLRGTDGEFPAEISVASMAPPFSDDHVLRWLIRDITERRKTEELLRLERERLFTVLDSLPAYIFLMASDYTIRFANRNFRETFGSPQGRHCYEILPGCIEPCGSCPSMQVFNTGRSRHWEWTRASTGRTYQIYGYPFKDVDGSPVVLELGIDITPRKRAEEALRESREELKYLYSRLLSVQEEERAIVARDLHDAISQPLAALKYAVETAVEIGLRDGSKACIRPLEKLVPMVQDAIEETRRIYMGLRPTILDDLGILATLEWFCRDFRRKYDGKHLEQNIEVEENDVPSRLKIVIFRIVQEALSNVARHSGAEFVVLSLTKTDEQLQICIEDNGVGFELQTGTPGEVSGGGLGIVGMRERTKFSGGSFSISSIVGEGTTVCASWPVSS